eukprot:Rhum_TRINITY_DN3952_c0_g1::Rhum_TRINITY_DN3952_c0_g1_i1::g.12458::m.12458
MLHPLSASAEPRLEGVGGWHPARGGTRWHCDAPPSGDVRRSRRAALALSAAQQAAAGGAAAVVERDAAVERILHPPQSPLGSAMVGIVVPQASSGRSARTLHHERLRRFFSFYDPAQLPHVSETLVSHRGQETEFFASLVAAFGPEPPNTLLDDVLPPGWTLVLTPLGDKFYQCDDGRRRWLHPCLL